MKMPMLSAGHEVTMEYSDNLTKEGEFDKQGESDVYIAGGQRENILGINSIIMLIVMSVSPTFRQDRKLNG